MENIVKKLLILDLDETIIYATPKPLLIQEDFKFDKYYIYKRPLLKWFLVEISRHFDVGIWSSADDTYVSNIVNLIKPEELKLEITWGRSRCSYRRDMELDEYIYEKRLDKLKKRGYRLEDLIIVYDTPEKSRTNYGNAIYIKEFLGEPNDEELKFLYEYLITLKNIQNIRTIEKRYWRK